MLAVVGMNATWRARGMTPQFFMEKDGECASPPHFFGQKHQRGEIGICRFPYVYDLFFVEGRERIIPLEMVL